MILINRKLVHFFCLIHLPVNSIPKISLSKIHNRIVCIKMIIGFYLCLGSGQNERTILNKLSTKPRLKCL